jgi:hypothetical protein
VRRRKEEVFVRLIWDDVHLPTFLAKSARASRRLYFASSITSRLAELDRAFRMRGTRMLGEIVIRTCSRVA